jgi:hypothetical protein
MVLAVVVFPISRRSSWTPSRLFPSASRPERKK